MKRFKKLIMIVAVVTLACVTLTACQGYKWGPVGTTSDSAAENNGTLAVKQGDYLYYVNGMDDVKNIVKPKDNYFGKASVKGSIMKSKIAEDGSLSETAVVVPKMFYTTYGGGGIYIYGDWIYYVSASTETDNTQAVLTSNLQYMRTKTDGTKTQSIAIITGATVQYTVTETSMTYLEGTALKKISFDNKKITKKAKVVAEDVASVMFTAHSNVIFYTKASADESLSNNEVFVIDGDSEPKVIINDKAYTASEKPALNEQFTIGLLKYNYQENALYYTKTSKDSAATVGTYGVALGTDFSFSKDGEVQFANKALATFTPLSIQDGLMDTTAASVFVYKPMTDSTLNNMSEKITFSAVPTIMFFEGEYVYYIINNNLMRINYKASEPVEEKISSETIVTTWLPPVKLGKYIYYINSANSNYLYRFDYMSYSFADGEIKLAKGEMVSGYIDNDKTEDGKIPQFMTEADKKEYIKAHPVKKDK